MITVCQPGGIFDDLFLDFFDLDGDGVLSKAEELVGVAFLDDLDDELDDELLDDEF